MPTSRDRERERSYLNPTAQHKVVTCGFFWISIEGGGVEGSVCPNTRRLRLRLRRLNNQFVKRGHSAAIHRSKAQPRRPRVVVVDKRNQTGGGETRKALICIIKRPKVLRLFADIVVASLRASCVCQYSQNRIWKIVVCCFPPPSNKRYTTSSWWSVTRRCEFSCSCGWFIDYWMTDLVWLRDRERGRQLFRKIKTCTWWPWTDAA